MSRSKGKKRRIEYSAWGRGCHGLDLPEYAMDDGVTALEWLVASSIARKNRLQICAGPRWDGTELERDRPVANTYQVTLGRPARGGGWTPTAEFWFKIQLAEVAS